MALALLSFFLFLQTRLQLQLKEAEAAVERCESTADWFAAASDRKEQTDVIHSIKDKLARLQLEESRVEAIKIRRRKVIY